MLKRFIYIFICITPLLLNAGESSMHFYDYEAKDIHSKLHKMSEYQGKVVLVVNVASKCGFTPQYEGLQKLYDKHHKKGLEILAFPCNQFREQEPGNATEIQNFCQVNYGVTFPLFEKIDVNGKNAHPLYTYLKKELTGFLGSESIKWNFTKFLIDTEGKVVERYGSTTEPMDIEEDIMKLLKKK